MKTLGTKTTIKLLKTILGNPLHNFKESELIKKAKTGKGSAGNQIKDLIKENILIRKKIGKTNLLSLNFKNPSTFLFKSLLDQEKISALENNKLATTLLFRNKIKEHTQLLILFGSSITGTATEKSDIDFIIVTNDQNKIQAKRKETEELLGERINLHIYSNENIKKTTKTDKLIQNALLSGIILHGYNLSKELLLLIKEPEKEKEQKINLKRILFFNERVKSAIRNYINKDYKTTKAILKTTLEQIIFYLLSEKKIPYSSKKNANKEVKKLPEGKIIQRINKAQLKRKVNLTEELIQNILRNKILEGEGYARKN